MELQKRNLRKERIGIVTSNTMDRSVVVSVERKVKHRIYGKYIKKTTKFFVNSPYASIINILANKKIVEDLLQVDCNSENIIAAIINFIVALTLSINHEVQVLQDFSCIYTFKICI